MQEDAKCRLSLYGSGKSILFFRFHSQEVAAFTCFNFEYAPQQMPGCFYGTFTVEKDKINTLVFQESVLKFP